MSKCQVGGQAISNGVAMKGKRGIATAIRNKDGSIDLRLKRLFISDNEKGFRSFPFFRGIFAFINSLKSGVDTFNLWDEIKDDIEQDGFISKIAKYTKKSKREIVLMMIETLVFMLISFAFIVLPSLVTYILKEYTYNSILLSAIESFLSISILLIYLLIIGKNDDMEQTFRYHGAEHKTIFCYEKSRDLTIENVRKEKRLHPRCGTNLIFNIIVNSNLVFIFLPYTSILYRIVFKIILIPFMISISYELINWFDRTNNFFSRILAFPGLKLQLLTTREPNDKELEVAILALKKSEGLRIEKTVRELLNEANTILKNAKIETYILDANLLLAYVLKKDKLWLMTNSFERISEEKEKEFLELVRKRESKYPMGYILEETEFMGIDFTVKEGVLIPRGDTEVLVEQVLKNIDEDESLEICDLCCGSGAIGLSLAIFRKDIKVDLLDIDKKPELVTKINIEKLDLSNRAKFIHSDLFKSVEDKKYDIIVSNPPYIREEVIDTLMEDVKNYEPHLALSGGEDGLVFYRKIIKDSVNLLKGKKILAFEIGHDQGEDVSNLMKESGFENIHVIKDLAGLDRVVIGKLPIE